MPQDFADLAETFRRLNPHVLRLWRWHLGWVMSIVPPVSGKILLLTHTGRKTGRRLHTPANYAVIDGDVWCTTHAQAQWLRNIQANPDVAVWLPLRRPRSAVAETMPVDRAHVGQLRRVLVNSGFAAATFAGIHPRRESDDELLRTCAEYHLLRLRRGDVVPRAEREPLPR